MPTTRRAFLAAAAALPLARMPRGAGKKILILGGTGYLGPHIVDAAKARGHSLTLFNRGKTNPQLFPDVEKLHGDRDPKIGDGLKELEGKRWDAVIDTSGYVPRITRASAELLAKACGQYVFISTISVYAPGGAGDVDEDAPLAKIADETSEKAGGAAYGALKALAEQAVETAMPKRTTVIRPSLIVGPGDETDRFTYWPVRVDRGGEVLAPGEPGARVQFIDVRDLAAFCVKTVEDGTVGTMNAVGFTGDITFEEVLHGCKLVAGADARFTWVEEAFLLERGVKPWTELPLWLPGRSAKRYTNARARAAGLAFRPVAQTIQATLDWHREERKNHVWKNVLTAERETALLAAWRERKK